MRIVFWAAAVCALLAAGFVRAENITVSGDMASTVRYELKQTVSAGDEMKKLMLSFVVPDSFESPTYRQKMKTFSLSFSPEASSRIQTTDARGNTIIQAQWAEVPRTVDAVLSFDVQTAAGLAPVSSEAPFPPAKLDEDLRVYLQATDLVQVQDKAVAELARRLTSNVNTQFDAVQRVISWIVDHVRYVNLPEQYDALYALHSGKGNCQNYSHLAAALLRHVGIPVRIVNGVTLNAPFDVAWDKGTITFKMGQGRHSWIEVWFPGSGWVPYDPQNMQYFVSSRFVRIEVGLDNAETKNDGLVRWIAAATAQRRPQLREVIDAEFLSDASRVKARRETFGPKNLLLGPDVRVQFAKMEPPPAPPPVPPVLPDERKKLRFDVPFVLGNLVFPEEVDFAFPRDTHQAGRETFEMHKTFLVETAEYVTTKATQYAQIVEFKKPARIERIALALHKFGGEGWLWVDIYEDAEGSPGKPLATTRMMSLDDLSGRPGYRWETFSFDQKDLPELMPGAYWIALGFSGAPVVNWFYTYGKPVGPVYGTRYKSVFEPVWSGALHYEFNYKIEGMTVK